MSRYDARHQDPDAHVPGASPAVAPGKRTLTQSLPPARGAVQLKAAAAASAAEAAAPLAPIAHEAHDDPFGMHLLGGA